MEIMAKSEYRKRIFAAYLLNRKNSNLSFWHTPLSLNKIDDIDKIGPYYMNFEAKLEYEGFFDSNGVPVLDYKGTVGKQYNPNAIAQYGLGCYDRCLKTLNPKFKEKFLAQANWFVNNIRMVDNSVGLWEYKFDWEYLYPLKSPWRSALAQGQGISVLARAYVMTQNENYLKIAQNAFESFKRPTTMPGGVTVVDNDGYVWFEEVVVEPHPPTHILNGFIWALWGVSDYYLVSGDSDAQRLYNEGVRTLEKYIPEYDIGFWTVYHLANNTKLKPIASSYYQRLHTLQLQAMYRLTNKQVFLDYANKWEYYYSRKSYRSLAFLWKVAFKFLYY